MKPFPWLNPWHAGRVMAASVLSCIAVAQPLAAPVATATATASASPPTLSQALDAAWQHSLEASEASGQKRRVQAEQGVAGAWLAATPALELLQREGRRNVDSRETEIGVALPLWRPGQRALAGQAAQAEVDWAMAAEQAARLRLAGLVRESAGAMRAQAAEAQLSRLQRQLLQRLSDDVARRVQAGDLAPADALAARADLMEAESQDAQAQQALQARNSHWQWLTGLALAPEGEERGLTAMAQPGLDAHPELRLASQALERARHRVALVQSQRGDAPELGLSLRQERPGPGVGNQHTVALGLRIPFGAQTHTQPRLAAALADQDLAQATEQRTRTRLSAELALAQSQLQVSTAQARLGQERAALLRERAALVDKSFRAGETPLPELLRALNAAAQADIAAARQQAALSLSQARLQQAAGLLP